jgi:hypothetical protein
MKDETITLLSLHRLPARLLSEQAAQVLGFSVHDLPVLVKARLLKPLGNPAQQATKYFAAKDIEDHATDTAWLHRATKAIYDHWCNRNQSRRSLNPHQNKTKKQTTIVHVDVPHKVSGGQATSTTTSL